MPARQGPSGPFAARAVSTGIFRAPDDLQVPLDGTLVISQLAQTFTVTREIARAPHIIYHVRGSVAANESMGGTPTIQLTVGISVPARSFSETTQLSGGGTDLRRLDALANLLGTDIVGQPITLSVSAAAFNRSFTLDSFVGRVEVWDEISF